MSVIHKINCFLGNQINEGRVHDIAASILKKIKPYDPRDAVANEAAKFADSYYAHTGQQVDPEIAANDAIAFIRKPYGNTHPLIAAAHEQVIDPSTPSGKAARVALQAKSRNTSPAPNREQVRAHVNAKIAVMPSKIIHGPTVDDLHYAASFVHDVKHLPMVAAIAKHRHDQEVHETDRHPASINKQGQLIGEFRGISINDAHTDDAARIHEAHAHAKKLLSKGINIAPDRRIAAEEFTKHDPVMNAEKVHDAYLRHRDTLHAWFSDQPLPHQPHTLNQKPVAENDTHRVYKIDGPETAGLKCWRPNGRDARYCLTAPGNGEHFLKNHYNGTYPFYIATSKKEDGERLAGAYVPSILHSHPTEGLRNAENSGPLTGKDFADLHPLLSKADSTVDEVAHRYKEGGDIHTDHQY